MKKIFVLAVFLVVIGVLCAVFFLRGGKDRNDSDEKPWTVGSQTAAAETTEETTQSYADAVEAFSDYVHTDLREDYAFLSEEDEPFAADSLSESLLSVYVYDMDTDGDEELAVVRTGQDSVMLDVYEYKDGKVRYADTETFTLDPMTDASLSLTDASLVHEQARLVIYPSGADRYFCLTVEQQDAAGEYNAYTVVLEYAKEKLTAKKSFRLRQSSSLLTLMCTDNVTLLYSHAVGQTAEPAEEPVEVESTEVGTDVVTETTTEKKVTTTPAKYGDLQTAFKTEFEKLGLNAPQVSVENGKLTQYKVAAVDSEQHLFDVTLDGGKIDVTQNGFLQSFILRR